jgi:predicted dehydrogenase
VVRAGLIGTGFGGAIVLPALATVPEIEVTAVCSARLDRAEALAARHGIATALDDPYRLIGSDDVDLVLVCTPPLTHAQLSTAALEAGHHVFSTKPLAATVSGARRLHEVAAERGVVTAMDFDNRYVPVRRYLRDLVRDGYLGRLRCVVGTVLWGLATDPTTRVYYWNWLALRDQSGGMLGASLGLHHIDLLRYTFGELGDVGGVAATLITEKPVHAEGEDEWGRLGPETPIVGMRPVDAEDLVVLHGRFASGGVLSLTASWSIYHGSGVRTEAYGSEGTLVLDASGRLHGARSSDAKLEELPVPDEYGDPELATDHVARFGQIFRDLAATIEGARKDALFATFEDGLRAREIADALIPPE